MLLRFQGILSPSQLGRCRQLLDSAPWIAGDPALGPQAGKVKHNLQIPEDHPASRELSEMVTRAVFAQVRFQMAALPLKIRPPQFSRYSGGQFYDTHVDSAFMSVQGVPHPVRSDLAATLFLSAPDEYDGGELSLEDHGAYQNIKLPAGDMVLYPSTTLHNVRPVTRGTRLVAFFWVQSMVRDDAQRALLFDLDLSIRKVMSALPNDVVVAELTHVYENLLRRWGDS